MQLHAQRKSIEKIKLCICGRMSPTDRLHDIWFIRWHGRSDGGACRRNARPRRHWRIACKHAHRLAENVGPEGAVRLRDGRTELHFAQEVLRRLPLQTEFALGRGVAVRRRVLETIAIDQLHQTVGGQCKTAQLRGSEQCVSDDRRYSILLLLLL